MASTCACCDGDQCHPKSGVPYLQRDRTGPLQPLRGSECVPALQWPQQGMSLPVLATSATAPVSLSRKGKHGEGEQFSGAIRYGHLQLGILARKEHLF